MEVSLQLLLPPKEVLLGATEATPDDLLPQETSDVFPPEASAMKVSGFGGTVGASEQKAGGVLSDPGKWFLAPLEVSLKGEDPGKGLAEEQW